MSTILFLGFLTPGLCLAQLNNSDEIIETIQDIQIQDDSSKKKEENPNKPKYDEEFGKQQAVPQEDSYEDEENIAQPEEAAPEEQNVERKELDGKDKESYENELEKNARKNRFERREISPEDMKRFEVDAPIVDEEPAAKAEEKPAPVVGSPQEPQPVEEALTPEEEVEQEISEIPEETPVEAEEEEMSVSRETKPTEITPEEPAGPPIYYAPEKTGPVISYKNEKTISEQERRNLSEKTKVEIEEDSYVEGTITKKIGDYLKPYKERRPTWTQQVSIGASQFLPINYYSDIMDASGVTDFDVFYEDSDTPAPEISFEYKRNFSWASLSLGAMVAYYTASGDGIDFTLMMPSIMATLYLDTLFDEPYVVPYGVVGYSYMMSEEKPGDGSEGLKAETDNMFVGFGVLFQLDWLDPIADSVAFNDMGIENTFVYLEGRTYMDQGIMRAEDDADFSTSTYIAGGLKLEF